MKKMRCSHLHFINAIRGNLVTKVRNVDVYGKPALKYKSVKEILEAQDTEKLQPSTSRGAESPDWSSRRAKYQTRSVQLPRVERSLEKLPPTETGSVHCNADDELDEVFGQVTLKQLKERVKTKKRKLVNSVDFKKRPKLEPEEDDSDREPLISLRLKLTKAKKKHTHATLKSDQYIDHEMVFHVKTEVPDPVISACQHKIPSIDNCPNSSQGVESSITRSVPDRDQRTVECPKIEPILLVEEQYIDHEMQLHRDSTFVFHVKTEVPDSVVSECQYKIPSIDNCPNIGQGFESSITISLPDRDQRTVECPQIEPILFVDHHTSCGLNEVSYDHLQDVKSNSLSIPTCEEAMDVDGHEENCQQFPDLPSSECKIETTGLQTLLITLPTKDEKLCTNSFSRGSSHIDEFMEQEGDHQAVLASNLAVDDCLCDKDPCHGNESLLSSDDNKNDFASNQQMDASISPASTFSTYWEHPLCLSANDNLLCGETEQKQSLPCSSPNGGESPTKPRNDLVSLEGKLTSDEHEENKTSDLFGEEKQERYSSSKIQSCDIDKPLLTPVLVHPPERLLLTRKVISPSSEERRCLAMNSAASFIEQDSKENPCLILSNQTENNASSVGSDANEAVNLNEPGITNRMKRIICLPKTAKRSKKDRRNSPPKGNFESPRLCRSLPRVSTGCTSLQGCSESAIAFSQRQMHDIESLVGKLTSELNNMKEIVEEKLLFGGYRNSSIKNDADEVKDAITNAVKVEETARKWLSMMARDCNRFCKIMSLTPKGTDPATSNNGIRRERKKVTFADEAGGILCHVKVFGDEVPFECNSENEETQTQ